MSEVINLSAIWLEIMEQSGAQPENIEAAKISISGQPAEDRGNYVFDQTNAVAQLGKLAAVIEWIEATVDMIPEEKLQRAKYFVDRVRIVENQRESGQPDIRPNEVLTKIQNALQQLARERNS